MGRRNEYQRKGGDAMRLGVQTRNGTCVGGGQNCVIPLLHTDHCLSRIIPLLRNSCTIHVLRDSMFTLTVIVVVCLQFNSINEIIIKFMNTD